MKNCPHNAFMSMVLGAIVLLLLDVHNVNAKRGCATFGHSCYGGMGKRASEMSENNLEGTLDVNQNEDNPGLVFTEPRSEFKERIQQPRLTSQQYDNLSRFVRQWIQSYRRAQQENMSI